MDDKTDSIRADGRSQQCFSRKRRIAAKILHVIAEEKMTIREAYEVLGLARDGLELSRFTTLPEEATKYLEEQADTPTCALVAELQKREGVQTLRVEPHVPYSVGTENEGVNSTGPAVVLVVSD